MKMKIPVDALVWGNCKKYFSKYMKEEYIFICQL